MKDFEKKNASSSNQDGDGIRIIEQTGSGSRAAVFYILLALILLACFAVFLFKTVIHPALPITSDKSSGNTVSGQNVPVANDTASSPEVTSQQARQVKVQAVKQQASSDPNDLSYYIAPGQTPKMEEVIERLHDAGIRTGIGAFNPPGTSPPMIGLAVPEDYALPEGYVRHYQATDDGQRIEPILMYSPDFEFFDTNGNPIVIPDNRVVPGNMAPPGLAIRPIQIPRPLEPGGP